MMERELPQAGERYQQVTTEEVETSPLVVRMHPVIDLTDDQFFEFCQINRDLRIERTARENC
jgi:hypothetical protein